VRRYFGRPPGSGRAIFLWLLVMVFFAAAVSQLVQLVWPSAPHLLLFSCAFVVGTAFADRLVGRGAR
jgi:hypothetical protein